MKPTLKFICGLLLLVLSLLACTDVLFIFDVTAVNASSATVGKTLVITIPVHGTNYSGSNGNGPVTVRATATGTFTIMNVTANVMYGQNGSVGSVVVTGIPTKEGANTGIFTFTSFCGTFSGDSSTLPYNILATSGILPTFAQTSGQSPRGEPVGTFTGELFDEQTHLRQNGPLGFGLTIYYASYLKANGIASALGTNWMHNYDLKLAVTGTSAAVTLFQGKTVAFTKSNNVWQVAATEPVPYQLVSVGTGYQFLSPLSRLIYSFDSGGALTRVEDRSGNALTVTAAPAGVGPAQVSDGLGRTLTFTYAGSNLAKVQDQSGRSISFEYTSGNLTGLTDANGKKSTYAYTAAGTLTGLITAETKPNGNQPFTQTFDAQGRVNKQSDSSANAMNLVYNTGSTSITEPLGVSFVDTHDVNGNLTSVGYAAGAPSQYAYDTKNRPTVITDRTGAKTTVTYDPASGFPASVTDQLNNTTSFRYSAATQAGFTFYDLQGITLPDATTLSFARDAKGNVTSLVDETGKTWQATWNTGGQILTFTNPSGGVTTFTYGNDGNLASIQAPSGDTSKVAYDTANRPNSITNPDNSTVSAQYDAADNPTRLSDERSNTTSLTYDANSNLLSATDSLGGVAALSYDNNDRVRSATNAAGKTARRTFDAVSRLATTSDEANVTLNYGYNNQNQLTGVTDSTNKGVAITNDAESRVTAVADALNRSTSFTRSARGQITTLTTPNNEKYTAAYDALGRLTSITDAAGRITQVRYDKRGAPIGTTYPGGITESFERNELSLITVLTNPNGNSWRRTFDNSGRLVSFADPLGRTFTYTYDSRQRLASVTNPLGTVQYTYDAASNLTRASYSDGTVLDYTYDALNRLTSADGVSIKYDGAGRVIQYNEFEITRDDAGRIATITYAPGQVARYTYNNLGLLAQIEDWAGGKVTFTYDAARQLTSKAFANGVKEDYTYDLNGRALTLKVTQGSQTLFSETVKRDALGRITSDDITGIAVPEPSGYVSQQFDAADQSYAAEYDALGRVTKDALRTYKWDLAGRLLSYTGLGGSAAFTYDGLGNVISRTPGPGGALQSLRSAGARGAGEGPALYARVGDIVLRSDGIVELCDDLAGFRPPVVFIRPNGTSTPLTTSIGGNISFTPDSAGNIVYLPPGGGPTVFQGDMPTAIGVTVFDPAGIRLQATPVNENTGTPLKSRNPVNILQFGESLNFASAFKRRIAPTADTRPIEVLRPSELFATAFKRRNSAAFSSEDFGTRLRKAFESIPASVQLFATTVTPSGPSTGIARLVSTDPNGAGSFSPVLRSPARLTNIRNNVRKPGEEAGTDNPYAINLARTVLPFPYVTNQFGFDTGLAISPNSLDPFGTGPQSGACALNYYGGCAGAGTRLESKFSNGSPCNTGKSIAATPGFQGYVIAQCNFQYAHGFAFISDVGSRNLSEGYLALVRGASSTTESGNRSEVLGH